MNIDWELLRKQKVWLLLLARKAFNNPDAWTDEDREMFDGLINLIDGIQDYAIDNGDATEQEVFAL